MSAIDSRSWDGIKKAMKKQRKVRNLSAKGYTAVNEFRKAFLEVGVKAQTITLSGQLSGIKGDLLVNGLRAEVKCGKQVNIEVLKKWIEKDNCDLLLLREQGGKQWVFLSFELFRDLLADGVSIQAAC